MALIYKCATLSPIPVITNTETCQSGNVGVEDKTNYSFGEGALKITGTAAGGTSRMFGFFAGNNVVAGKNNCVIGANASKKINSSFNVVIGAQAMQDAASNGDTMTVVGYNACANSAGCSDIVAIGANASVTWYANNVIVIGSVSAPNSLIDSVVIGSSIAPQTLFCNGITPYSNGVGSWYAANTSDKPIAADGAWYEPTVGLQDIKIV